MRYEKFNNIEVIGQVGVSPVGDDTKLIAKRAAQIKGKLVLDVGTGTGFIPIYLACLGRQCQGVDINEYAISCAQQNSNLNRVVCKFYQSDLFSQVKDKFDLITFNPPFGNTSGRRLSKLLEVIKSLIPKDNDLFIKLSFVMIRQTRRKLIERFLNSAKKHLKKNGCVLILLYPPELKLIEGYTHSTIGKYKDFSLVSLSF